MVGAAVVQGLNRRAVTDVQVDWAGIALRGSRPPTPGAIQRNGARRQRDH
jgi:hypothetical protein